MARVPISVWAEPEGLGNLRTLRTGVRRVAREAAAAVAEMWKSHYLPLHFSGRAERRYKYAPRTKKYEKRKRREKGHNRALVWSRRLEGMTRRSTLNTKSSSSAKNGTVGVNLILKAPRYAHIKGKKTRVRPADEIVRTIPAEKREMDRVFEDQLQGGLEALARKRASRGRRKRIGNR